jgi:hypothetical protein
MSWTYGVTYALNLHPAFRGPPFVVMANRKFRLMASSERYALSGLKPFVNFPSIKPLFSDGAC